jgi:hypothetical protein
MALHAYATSTSAARGEPLGFVIEADGGTSLAGLVSVEDAVSGGVVVQSPFIGRSWELDTSVCPSGLYRANFGLGGTPAYFIVRAANPGEAAPILVSIPFPTWEAYNRAGTPGEGLYWNEQPTRAHSVTLDRPGAGPTGWETGMLDWLPGSGYAVEYCSGFDLDDGAELLSAYQLLVCLGHDEYWSKGMRDSVESFVASGGNLAIFSGNTCWWQVRIEDDGRTLTCYRDATADPLTGVDDSRVTVEWSSAPVSRPENHLTGLSFRLGAGCWGNTGAMATAGYTAAFAEHWVFNGTGLADGDKFAVGAVGYETDAAETVLEDGIPVATGRDGTPESFVVLAIADLSDWRRWGQGGAATMGIFERGGGRIFNAGTTGWGGRLAADSVVEQITRNVLDRLGAPRDLDVWELAGEANDVRAMVACENHLFAADATNTLWVRRPIGQNVHWRSIGHANDVIALASPREAMAGRSLGLYALTTDGTVWYRDPELDDRNWVVVSNLPGAQALAASYEGLFAATNGNDLMYQGFGGLSSGAPWFRVGHAIDVLAMTNLNGRLFAATSDQRLWSRLPVQEEIDWAEIGSTPPLSALAGSAGRLWAATADNRLVCRRLPGPA